MTRATPESRDRYRLFQPITTRWMDNDQYGHLNNVVYYSLFDTVVNRFLIDNGLVDPLGGAMIGLVVNSHCHYFAPLAFPEPIEGGLRVDRIGSSSVAYGIGIFAQDAGTAAAQGGFVHVYVDSTTRRPMPLPDPMRAALREIAVD
ncbi:acyl-CoA thioesterase [Microbaculum marinisediminis]|uniref:Acyl-CoA thioesterase n=1 Tax=Microbaculum marinisediminis TaxID=2931392 RepID=A0AAW5R216_9HYPH|nr:thioesterase family protein [Microbaculum sp. A6E488]MCT8973167.1 acyl-CoA thioesterase [Microbaculum sp. A6E488]